MVNKNISHRMLFKQAALSISKILWYGTVAVLALLAVYVSLGRYYMPLLTDYEKNIEQWLFDEFELRVKFTGLRGGWAGFSPVIYADRFEIFSNQNASTVFSASQITISIALPASLRATELRLGKVAATDVAIQLEEYAPKRWRMSGLPARNEGGSTDIFLDVLLSVRRVELLNLAARLAPYQKSQMEINMSIFKLDNDVGYHRLQASLTGDSPETSIAFLFEINGDPRFIDTFTAKAYAKLDRVSVEKFYFLTGVLDFDPKGVVISTELWGNWQKGGFMDLQGIVSIPTLDTKAIFDKPYQPINKIRTEFLLEMVNQDNWSLRFKNLNFEWYDHVWLFNQFMVSKQETTDVKTLSLATDSLDLDPVSSFLNTSKLLDKHLLDVITTLDPQGRLTDFHLDFPMAEPSEFLLSANLEDVSVKPWSGAPGGSGISGLLAMNRNNGRVLLKAENFSMSFPHIYHDDLRYKTAAGSVFWQIDSNGTKVFSKEVQFQDDISSAAGGFWLDIPAKESEEEPTLVLDIGLKNATVQERNKYLPYILSPGLLSWLDSSLLKGHINEGGFYYRSSLKKGSTQPRTTQLFFDVHDVDLQYQQKWPALQQIDGLVLIDDEKVSVTADQARVYDSAVSDTQVIVTPLGEGSKLYVDASIEGPVNDGLRVLRESPLQDKVGGSFDNWIATGSGRTSLNIDMFLYDQPQHSDPVVDVDVTLGGNGLNIKPLNLLFDSVKGDLHFDTDKGLHAEQLTATLWRKPVSASIAEKTGESNEKITEIFLSGSAEADAIQRWIQNPLLKFAHGETNFKANLKIIDNDKFLLGVTSDLVGIKSDFPEPFAKEFQEPIPFRMRYARHAGQALLNMDFGEIADSAFILTENVMMAGALRVGKEPAVLPLNKQFAISGSVPSASFDKWQSWLADYQQVARHEGQPFESDAVDTVISDLQLDHLTISDIPFADSKFNLWSEPGLIRIQLENSVISGVLTVPNDKRMAYMADLAYIHLDHFVNDAATEDASAAADHTKKIAQQSFVDTIKEGDFSGWPTVQLSVAQVFNKGDNYGNWVLKAIPAGDTLILEDIIGTIRGIQISGVKGQSGATLRWQRNKQVNVTSFSGLLTASDLTEVLPLWGYEGGLTSEKATTELAVQWPGDPTAMNMDIFDGSMTMKLRNGRFLAVSKPTSGALRFVSAINISELLRRVTLDFSDIYKKGLTYDSIKGSFNFNQGVLTTAKPLEMKGPSSYFAFTGVIDLPNNRLDMEMTVTLPVSNNLPWIAAITGGFPVAAGVYVANKLFENQVDRFSSALYEIKGTLDKPEVKFKRVFEKKPKKQSKNK